MRRFARLLFLVVSFSVAFAFAGEEKITVAVSL